MAGPEDWAAQIEALQRAGQRFARNVEQVSRAFAAARARWQPVLEAWRVAHARGDFRHFQTRLRLAFWMVEQVEAAKDNPMHRAARAWLLVQHLSPKQIQGLLAYMVMDLGDLRVPKRRGKRIAASTRKLVEQLDQRIKDTGELPTTAARRLIADLGFRGKDAKGRADYLVRAWKDRALYSR